MGRHWSLSLPEVPTSCWEPEALVTVAVGVTGLGSPVLVKAGPTTGGPWQADVRGCWRTTGEISSCGVSDTGPRVAFLVGALWSRFSRSSCDTVFGLGRGPCGGGVSAWAEVVWTQQDFGSVLLECVFLTTS